MKRFAMLLGLMVWAGLMTAPAFSQDQPATPKPPAQHGPGFVDKNGDGWNDLAPDHDGDGIPNGSDPDWIGPNKGRGQGFVDANGDGIDDRSGAALGRGRGGRGPGNAAVGPGGRGQGNGAVGRAGNGAGGNRGWCNGAGPGGRRMGRGRQN